MRQAIAIAPEDPVLLNAYGFVLAKQNKFQPAIKALEDAIRLDPRYPEAYCNLGWAREAIGDIIGGEQSLETAIALEPDYADALARLAEVAYRRGEFDRSLALADRALGLDARQYTARKAQGRIAIARGDYAVAESIVTTLLADETLPAAERVHANGLRGDLLHAQGRYGEAFQAYKTANDEDRALYASRFGKPGAETAYTYAAWLAEYFGDAPTSDWSARAARGAPLEDSLGGARSHVFLVGFPRSGTTLLENVLASHPGVVTLEEKATLVDATRAFLTNAAGRERLRTLGAEDATAHRAAYWQRVRKAGAEPAGKVLVDKDPLASITLPVMAKLFPKSKILFALRDPRDVVLGSYRRTFLMNASMFELTTLDHCARYYDAVMRLAQIYREKLGLDWYDLRHETLTDDFEGETRRVCAFIGVDWNAEMLEFADHARSRPSRRPARSR